MQRGLQEDHQKILELTRNTKKLYEYSNTQFLSIEEQINLIQCDLQDSVKTLANYIVISRLQAKMYADLIGAIELVFSHSLSPVLLPPINLRGLIEKNMAFFRNTIDQRKADLLDQFASVYPVLTIEH